MVVFKVDDETWHGHPDPLDCPEDSCRKSLAVYYYTLHEQDLKKLDHHSTDYKKRPSDETNEEIERMRIQRRKGRLKDSTT